MKKSTIQFDVELDENNIPDTIRWNASDAVAASDAKAIMLSVWDKKELNTLRIDLWTKEMTIDEMKQFFHQTLLTMSDTFQRATGDQKMSATMKDFCDYFAEKMDLIKK